MVFPEGVKTIRWDKEGKNVVERDVELSVALKNGSGRANTLPGLKPLDLEEWLEENYNVMA